MPLFLTTGVVLTLNYLSQVLSLIILSVIYETLFTSSLRISACSTSFVAVFWGFPLSASSALVGIFLSVAICGRNFRGVSSEEEDEEEGRRR